MRSILAAFLFIQACGSPSNLAEPVVLPGEAKPVGQAGPDVDPELLEALQVWKEDCYKYSSFDCKAVLDSLTSVKVVELEKYTLGQCELRTSGFVVVRRDVKIAPSILAHPLYLRAVLAHEVGHCAFYLDHVTNDDEHLMAPYMQPERVLEKKLPAMLQQFYAQAKAQTLPRIKD